MTELAKAALEGLTNTKAEVEAAETFDPKLNHAQCAMPGFCMSIDSK